MNLNWAFLHQFLVQKHLLDNLVKGDAQNDHGYEGTDEALNTVKKNADSAGCQDRTLK